MEPSLYAKYLMERLGDSIIEAPEGFVTYRFLEDNKTVYIVDIFVKEEFRTQGIASKLADMVVEKAKALGSTKLLGTVIPTTKNSTISLKVLLGYGMVLESATNNLIVFKKEI